MTEEIILRAIEELRREREYCFQRLIVWRQWAEYPPRRLSVFYAHPDEARKFAASVTGRWQAFVRTLDWLIGEASTSPFGQSAHEQPNFDEITLELFSARHAINQWVEVDGRAFAYSVSHVVQWAIGSERVPPSLTIQLDRELEESPAD